MPPMSRINSISTLIVTFVSFVPLEAAALSFSTFDYPGSTSTTLAGINDSGQMVGSFGTATTYQQGFIRNGDGSLVPLIFPFSTTANSASGTNSSGDIVGAFLAFTSGGYFRSAGGAYTVIVDPLNPDNSGPSAINDSGQMVGSYGDPSNAAFAHGFLRDTNGAFTTIDDPNMAINQNGNKYTQVNGINNLGEIVGTYTDAAGTHGFLRTPGGVFTTIDDPVGSPGSTLVWGINNLGVIVGTFSGSSGFHSFIRSADGSSYTTFDDPDGFYTAARGINDNGEIVGSFVTSLRGGRLNGFIATPAAADVPEPVSLEFLLVGIAAMIAGKLRN